MISAPKNIYGPNLFKMFVHELGGPKLVCKKLDVSERTVRRWLAEGTAPRMAVLALYWESQYGRSLIDVEHHHEICIMRTRIRILEEQFVRAKDVITGMKLLNYGTSNEPYFDERSEFDENNPASAIAGQGLADDENPLPAAARKAAA